jgi:hypothetical protein
MYLFWSLIFIHQLNLSHLLGTARGNRVSAMRAAIWDTFPEPNRRLLQRYWINYFSYLSFPKKSWIDTLILNHLLISLLSYVLSFRIMNPLIPQFIFWIILYVNVDTKSKFPVLKNLIHHNSYIGINISLDVIIIV